jgi:SPP1 gp7 family putative phage head morphogenesis protein
VKFTDKQIEDIIKGVYDGSLTTQKLPEDLYMAIGDYLSKAVMEGFGGDIAEFGGSDLDLFNELNENVYMFSGAKTYHEINDISLIKDGDVKDFKSFREEALKVYDQYNVNWMEAEYKTAVGQAQNAIRWNQIQEQKNVLPFLRYSAVVDENTSDICLPLDGIVLPVDDPFWDSYMPLNHFNCRCTVEQLDEYDAKVTDPDTVDEKTANVDEKINDVFKMNPGKDAVIFNSDHPYFQVAKKDKAAAKENFGLPMPDAIAQTEAATFKTFPESQEWIKKNPPSETSQEAIRDYTSNNYRNINEFLRTGKKEFSSEKVNKTIEDLTAFIDESPKCEFKTYRGLSFTNDEYDSFIVDVKKNGIELFDKGFMSTTASKKEASIFSEFTANSAQIEVHGRSGVNIGNDHKEILFKPNTRFQVIGMKQELGPDGERIVKLKLLEK